MIQLSQKPNLGRSYSQRERWMSTVKCRPTWSGWNTDRFYIVTKDEEQMSYHLLLFTSFINPVTSSITAKSSSSQSYHQYHHHHHHHHLSMQSNAIIQSYPWDTPQVRRALIWKILLDMENPLVPRWPHWSTEDCLHRALPSHLPLVPLVVYLSPIIN